MCNFLVQQSSALKSKKQKAKSKKQKAKSNAQGDAFLVAPRHKL
jgi:hypothetical protein